MKISTKQGVLAAMILAMGVSLAGTAAAAPDGEVPRSERAEKHEPRKERFAKQAEERFAELEKALSLRPDQQKAWAEYRESFVPAARGEGQRHERAATAPQRAAQHEAFAEARLEHVRKVRSATDAFYGKLDEEQRKVLDEHRFHRPKDGKAGHKAPKSEPRE